MSCFRAIARLQREDIENRGAEHRAKPRMKCHGVRCREGRVLDVSAGGLRMRTKGRPPGEGSVIRLVLEGDACRAEVVGTIAWSRKLGWSGYEVGIRLSSEGGRDLFRLAYNPLESEWASAKRRPA